MQECILGNGRKVRTTQDPTVIKKILDELVYDINLMSPSNTVLKKQAMQTAVVKLNKCGFPYSDVISLFISLLDGIPEDSIYSAVKKYPKKSKNRKSKIYKKRITQERMIIQAAATDMRRGCGKKYCIEEATEELHKLGHSKRKIIELLKNGSLGMVSETFMIRVVRKYKFNRVIGKASTKEEIPQDQDVQQEDQREEKQPWHYNTPEDVEEITDLAKAKAVCCNALNRRDYFEQELKTSQKSLIQAMEQRTYNISLNIKALQLAKENIPIVVTVQLLSSTPVDATIDYEALKDNVSPTTTEANTINNTKNVRLNDWTYNYISKHVLYPESFSDTIDRLLKIPKHQIVATMNAEPVTIEYDPITPQINKIHYNDNQFIDHGTERYAERVAARLDKLDTPNKECSQCHSSTTTIDKRKGRPDWRHDENGNILCNSCKRDFYRKLNKK